MKMQESLVDGNLSILSIRSNGTDFVRLHRLSWQDALDFFSGPFGSCILS